MSPSAPVKRPVTSKKSTLVAGAVLVVVAVLVIVGVIYQNNRSTPQNDGYGTAQASAVHVSEGVVRVGTPDAPVTIDVFEDFLCPACAQFEKVYGQELAQALDEGKVAARYHMLNFLDKASASKSYSTRAAAAALCVAADGSGSAYPRFHSTLFDRANQPEEGSGADLSDAALADLAAQAGAPGAQQCITSGAQMPQAGAAAQAGIQRLAGVLGPDKVGTPTVLNGGQQVSVTNSDWIAQLR